MILLPASAPQVHAQVQGGQQFMPPRLDVHSPDLYLPLMALWTYVIGVLLLQLAQHRYKPDSMYSMVRGADWLPDPCCPC